MFGPEQRQSHRVPFQVPARIVAPNPVVAVLDDLSRTGARLHVAVKVLGLAPGPSLHELARCVQERIGANFEVELHYEVLGPLLAKSATLVRIGTSPDDPHSCQLACAFDLPLTNEETVMLGVPLPVKKGAVEDWIPRADTPGPIAHQSRLAPAEPPSPEPEAPAPEPVAPEDPAPTPALPVASVPVRPGMAPRPEASGGFLEPSPLRRKSAGNEPAKETPKPPPKDPPSGSTISRRIAGGAANRWRAFVSAVDRGHTPILSCTMDEICSQSVRVRVWRGPGGTVLDGTDPATVGVAFIDRYGDQVGLKIMDGAAHVWTGPTRVRAVEVPRGRPGEVLLTLAFDRSLTSHELERLGLA